MGFVHLNVASAYSAHYGVNRPEHMVAAASEIFDALAITDRDGLYGAIKHIGSCIANKVSPIVGVNLSVKNEFAEGRVLILAMATIKAVAGLSCVELFPRHTRPKLASQ